MFLLRILQVPIFWLKLSLIILDTAYREMKRFIPLEWKRAVSDIPNIILF